MVVVFRRLTFFSPRIVLLLCCLHYLLPTRHFGLCWCLYHFGGFPPMPGDLECPYIFMSEALTS